MRKLVTLLFTLVFAASAFAQGGAIAVGDSVTDTATDNVEYTIDLGADETITITLTSDEFDTYIEVFDGSGNSLNFDDDGGDGTNSALEFTAPGAGTYTLLVRSFFGTADGEYTLAVSGDGGNTDGTLGTLLGGNSGGSTETFEGDATGDKVEYDVNFEQGQTVQIDLISSGFDALLEIRDASGALIESNDDGGEGTNSQITFTAPNNATYTLVVSAFGGSPSGAYTLTVAPQGGATSSDGSIAYGDTVTVSAGSLVSDTTFEASAGDVINAFAVSADDEDIKMFLISPSGAELVEDDDSGEGLNPYVRRFPLTEAGTYVIRVEPLDEVAMDSAFDLTLEQSELLDLSAGSLTVTIGEETDLEVIALDVSEGTSYIVSITVSEALESTLFGDILEAGESYADLRFNVSGMSEIAFVYTAQTTGRAIMSLEYFGFQGGIDLTISLEKMS